MERNPASLLNHDNFTDDEAMVETSPLVPVKAKPWDKLERKRFEEIVELADEKKPLPKPRVVEVELKFVFEVNGKTVKLASLVNCDVLMVLVANEYTCPFAPMPAKPEVRDER